MGNESFKYLQRVAVKSPTKLIEKAEEVMTQEK